MCPRVSHVYMDKGPKEVKITGMGRMGGNFQRKGENRDEFEFFMLVTWQ